MKPQDHARKRIAGYVAALVLYVVFCWPGLSLAQTDSVEVAAPREDLERLEEDLKGCQNQTAELARLLEFTEKFPHQYGRAEIQAFQQQLAALSGCLSNAQTMFDKVSQRLPKKPDAPPKREAERREEQGDAPLAGLREKREALHRQLKDLTALKKQVEAQLDQLAKKLPPPDSTRHDGNQPGT